MRERWRRIRPILFRVVGYPLFFAFWFVVFLYATFPYDRLKDALVASVDAPRRAPNGTVTPSTMQLTIGELGPTFLPGLEARNVNVTFLPARAGDATTRMHINRATVHVGLMALLSGTLRASVDIDGAGGTIRGEVVNALRGTRPGLRALNLRLDNVRPGQIGPLVSAVGLPLSGSMDGTIDLRIPDGVIAQAAGSIRLTIDDFRVGDGHAQYRLPIGPLTIEQIRAGQLNAVMDVANGVATIRQFAARSDEFRLNMDGQINLAPELGQSELRAGVRFQLTDAYRNKSEVAGRIMTALDFSPDLRAARRPDGMWGFRCTGAFSGGMRCPPDTRGAGGGAAGAGSPPGRRGFDP